MLYAIVVVLILIADQLMKYWVTANITLNSGSITLIPGILKLVNIHNEGAAFSLFPGWRWLFVGLAAAVTIAVILALIFHWIKSGFGRWMAVLTMAGALGNAIDRAIYGYVVDMFVVEPVKFLQVFNVADIFITVGGILFCLYLIISGGRYQVKRNTEENEASAPDETEEPAAEENGVVTEEESSESEPEASTESEPEVEEEPVEDEPEIAEAEDDAAEAEETSEPEAPAEEEEEAPAAEEETEEEEILSEEYSLPEEEEETEETVEEASSEDEDSDAMPEDSEEDSEDEVFELEDEEPVQMELDLEPVPQEEPAGDATLPEEESPAEEVSPAIEPVPEDDIFTEPETVSAETEEEFNFTLEDILNEFR